MFCARCGKPLKEKDAEAVGVDRPTGPGITLYVHRTFCEPDPLTTPVSWPEPTREG